MVNPRDIAGEGRRRRKLLSRKSDNMGNQWGERVELFKVHVCYCTVWFQTTGWTFDAVCCDFWPQVECLLLHISDNRVCLWHCLLKFQMTRYSEDLYVVIVDHKVYTWLRVFCDFRPQGVFLTLYIMMSDQQVYVWQCKLWFQTSKVCIWRWLYRDFRCKVHF